MRPTISPAEAAVQERESGAGQVSRTRWMVRRVAPDCLTRQLITCVLESGRQEPGGGSFLPPGDLEILEMPLDGPGGREALCRILSTQGRSREQVAREAQLIVDRQRSRGERWGHVVVVREGREMVFAAAATETAGRAGLILASEEISREHIEGAAGCMRRLVEGGRNRSISLLEVLVDPNQPLMAEILEQAGFRRLTVLHYMSRWVQQPDPEGIRAEVTLSWTSYSEDIRGLFLQALEASYEDSGDCPELTGLRRTEEVLAGHAEAGRFTPDRWWVVRSGNDVAGVALINELESAPASEVVYLGVSKKFRRGGVAGAMLRRALQQARGKGDRIMTLAADRRNEPALAFYRRWGFERSLERAAWIATNVAP
ncbi:MAG: GNAT family N-acetyltransferase [Phycisphaerae bacterium]|nr:GNAT family N-acetyltransferase [Phycisphaerae bacterium]